VISDYWLALHVPLALFDGIAQIGQHGHVESITVSLGENRMEENALPPRAGVVMQSGRTYSFVYRIDQDNCLAYVSPEWLEFAQSNQAAALSATAIQGHSLLEYIMGDETRYFYQMILDRVRTEGCTITIPFRCDSPAIRRFMELIVEPLADGSIQFEGRLIREEYREPVALLDPDTPRSNEYIVICSWCKHIQVGDAWLEVEQAVRTLSLFDSINLPQLTHGMCNSCKETFKRQFATKLDR